MKKYYIIVIIFILVFIISFPTIQKVLANNVTSIAKPECRLSKSTLYSAYLVEDTNFYSSYYYTDSGEMIKYSTPVKNILDKVKVKTKDFFNDNFLFLWSHNFSRSPYIVLYDKYGNSLGGNRSCKDDEDYLKCKSRNLIYIKSYYTGSGNLVQSYYNGDSDKSPLLNLYMFNSENQLLEKRHKETISSVSGYYGVQYQYQYNSNGLIETEYVTNYYKTSGYLSDNKNKYSQAKYKNKYIYDSNKNVITKEIEFVKCENCNGKIKTDKFYQKYKYDKNNNIILEEGYIPKALDENTYKFVDDTSKYALKYEYDSNGNLIKETKFYGGLGANVSYARKYKYDKYGNIVAKYSCSMNNDKDCRLYEKLKYECK